MMPASSCLPYRVLFLISLSSLTLIIPTSGDFKMELAPFFVGYGEPKNAKKNQKK